MVNRWAPVSNFTSSVFDFLVRYAKSHLRSLGLRDSESFFETGELGPQANLPITRWLGSQSGRQPATDPSLKKLCPQLPLKVGILATRIEMLTV